MKKRMRIMLIVLGILFGGIFGWKLFTMLMMKRYLATMSAPVQTVSTMKVTSEPWQDTVHAVGSVRAILGVNVTTELAGMVQTIYFKPGSKVQKGTVLVQLNADTEKGQLLALEAQAELANVTYKRDQAQYTVQAVSKQQVDSDKWNLRNLEAQILQQRATTEKKTLRAPFSGRLGISQVNPGQYLNVGDTVTTLQTLDPIYLDFYVPQQDLAHLKLDQAIYVKSDTYPNKTFKGKITTIEPLVSVDTRNVRIEATLENRQEKLVPGMYATIDVIVSEPKSFLTLPQSAISFNPYGNIVFLIKEKGKDDNKEPIYTVTQVFVTTGETRGDQIQVLTGIKKGDIVVTSGQLKLQNDSRVKINNTIQPSNSAHPKIDSKT